MTTVDQRVIALNEHVTRVEERLNERLGKLEMRMNLLIGGLVVVGIIANVGIALVVATVSRMQ